MREWECLGMAISTLIHAEVEFMTEDRRVIGVVSNLERHDARRITRMTLGAIAGNGKGVLAVMTRSASFAAFHGGHRQLQWC